MLKRMGLASLGLLWAGLVFSNTQLPNTLSASGQYFQLSFQDENLIVTTTTPGKRYETAGIRLMTRGYSITDTTLPSGNGYFLFAVSDTQPASINIDGPEGSLKVNLCLSGTGQTYSCEVLTIAIPEFLPKLISYSRATGTGVGTTLVPGLGILGPNNIHFYGLALLGSGECDTATTLSNYSGIPINLSREGLTSPPGFPDPCLALCNGDVTSSVFPGASAHCTNAVVVSG